MKKQSGKKTVKTIKRRSTAIVGKIRTVSYRLPVSVFKAVNLRAAERGIGKSALVELALRRLLRLKKEAA